MLDMTVINPDMPDFRIKSLDEIKEYWQRVYVPMIEKSDCDKIVFSNEVLNTINLEFFDIIKESGFDVKIIVYIRKPAELYISNWAQVVNLHFAFYYKNFSEHINTIKKSIYSLSIDKIKHVGIENSIIRPYEKEQWKNENLIDDFLNCLGIDLCDDFVYTERKNVSPSRDKIELLRLKNALKLDRVTMMNYANEMLKLPENHECPKIIETFSDEDILYTTQKLMPEIEIISKYAGKEKFFVNDFPACYKKERPKYNTVQFSFDELEILHRAINDSINIRENLVNALDKLKKENESLKTTLERQNFCASWIEKNHKVYKFGKIKLKFKL